MEKDAREKLINQIGSVYKLCNLAAIRAMELNNGMKKLTEADPDEKVTTIAIKEIAEGKVRIEGIKRAKDEKE
jgi:DNA-directed RNA polymerase omega subunit